MINPSEGHVALDRNSGPGTIPYYSNDWSQEIFKVYVPIDSAIHHQAF